MRHSLFQTNEKTTPASIKIAVSRPHGKNIGNDVVATGHYDNIEEKWLFNCSEPETLRWLQTSFAQPVNVVGGCLPVYSVDFVTYMRDVVAHRKGLVIDIQDDEVIA
jgi:hypothetical protein